MTVKLDQQHTTVEIQTTRGLKQGCVLAPLLFNLYTTELGKSLEGSGQLTPKRGLPRIQVLQYKDDLVILDHTRVGLQRTLDALNQYNQKNAPRPQPYLG